MLHVVPATAHTSLLCLFSSFGDTGRPILITLIVELDSERITAFAGLIARSTNLTLLLVSLIRHQLKVVLDLLFSDSFKGSSFSLRVPSNFWKLMVREKIIFAASSSFVNIISIQKRHDFLAQLRWPGFVTRDASARQRDENVMCPALLTAVTDLLSICSYGISHLFQSLNSSLRIGVSRQITTCTTPSERCERVKDRFGNLCRELGGPKCCLFCEPLLSLFATAMIVSLQKMCLNFQLVFKVGSSATVLYWNGAMPLLAIFVKEIYVNVSLGCLAMTSMTVNFYHFQFASPFPLLIHQGGQILKCPSP